MPYQGEPCPWSTNSHRVYYSVDLFICDPWPQLACSYSQLGNCGWSWWLLVELPLDHVPNVLDGILIHLNEWDGANDLCCYVPWTGVSHWLYKVSHYLAYTGSLGALGKGHQMRLGNLGGVVLSFDSMSFPTTEGRKLILLFDLGQWGLLLSRIILTGYDFFEIIRETYKN